jgi:hypothetical protein
MSIMAIRPVGVNESIKNASVSNLSNESRKAIGTVNGVSIYADGVLAVLLAQYFHNRHCMAEVTP